jgi:serine/threonine-protein kinase HipA
MAERQLIVWYNGVQVGTWTVGPMSQHQFVYDEEWIAQPHSRPISFSLPLSSPQNSYQGERVRSFFDNLLPDSSDIRLRIKNRYRLRTDAPFDLLMQVGRDCIGAIQLLPPDKTPALSRIEGRALSEHDVAEVLRAVVNPGSFNTMHEEEFRLSLAGAQEKTALLLYEGVWHVPYGSIPSTHIFKLPLGKVGPFSVNLDTSIENEWICSLISRELGINTAKSSLHRFEDLRVLIVERFDRRYSDDRSYIIRLPQEDFCQATATPSSHKYEADGGPNMGVIMNFLLGSSNSERDRQQFYSSQILFWLLAAPDGHAKNFSIFIDRGSQFRLTPQYDIISAYPFLGRGASKIAPEKLTMAMSFTTANKHYRWNQIVPRHIYEAAQRIGYGAFVETIVSNLSEKLPDALERVSDTLPSDFPVEVSEPILEGVFKQYQRLIKG